MDIVYLFKEDTENDSEELRYSLRSLRNIPHDKVVIVGEKPDWVQNVLFMPVPQDRTKAENVSRNITTALRDDRISDDFVLMNDDFFFMKSMPAVPNWNLGPMDQVLRAYDERYPETTDYVRTMRTLYDILRARGYDRPISYELHTPMVINRHKARQLYDTLQGERMYQFRTYYGNFWKIGGQTVKDVKVFLEPRHNNPDYNQNPRKYLESQLLLSATGGSFKRGPAGEFIRYSFSDKSPYEL